MTRDRVRRAPMIAVLVTAIVAFLASSIGGVPALAGSKKAGASFEAARLATTVGLAKPTPRKADRAPGAAAIPRVSVPVPSYRVSLAAASPPASWTPPAKARAELMVFLI